MRVFVLCTGRCGSKTFARACRHATNFTAAHESKHLRTDLSFPDNHIEVNNRLIWYAGLLEERFPNARYVHLTRDPEQTAQSYVARGANQRERIVYAWRHAVRMGWMGPPRDLLEDAREYVHAASALIRCFLRGRDAARVDIDQPDSFAEFWRWVGAEGDLAAALETFRKIHNAGRRQAVRPAEE